MKRIFSCIIILSSLFFSSVFSVNAEEWYIEKLLELRTYNETSQLQDSLIEKRVFQSKKTQKPMILTRAHTHTNTHTHIKKFFDITVLHHT